MENAPTARKWWNLVQWVRQKLVERGEIDGSTRGVWRITDAGRARLNGRQTESSTHGPRPRPIERPADVTLRDLANASVNDVKARLLTELANLTPRAFEHFCIEFLERLGYREVSVTKRSNDGGIDGFGDFRQGAVRIKSAFQAKRWIDSPVGRPEIDKFRGAIQGEYDHGVFLTTSRFTEDAQRSSVRRGAITIMLLDGAAIADLMVDWGIGVARQPLYIYDVDPAFFDFDDD
jgi:restriction system protein